MGCHFLTLRDLPDPAIKSASLESPEFASRWILYHCTSWEPQIIMCALVQSILTEKPCHSFLFCQWFSTSAGQIIWGFWNILFLRTDLRYPDLISGKGADSHKFLCWTRGHQVSHFCQLFINTSLDPSLGWIFCLYVPCILFPLYTCPLYYTSTKVLSLFSFITQMVSLCL